MSDFSDRLLAALKPPAPLDRFDDMAIDFINLAQTLPFTAARQQIAMRLRLQDLESAAQGACEALTQVRS